MKKQSPTNTSSNLEHTNDFENLILKPIDQDDQKAVLDNHIASSKQASLPLFLESPFRRFSRLTSIKIGETTSGENNPGPECLPSIADSGALMANRNSLHITIQKDPTRSPHDIEDLSRSDTFHLTQSPKPRLSNSHGGLSPSPKKLIEFGPDIPSPSFQVKEVGFFQNDTKKEEHNNQLRTTGNPRDGKNPPKPRKSVSLHLPFSPKEYSALLGFKAQTLEPSPAGFWNKAKNKVKIFRFSKPRKRILSIFTKSEVEMETSQRALQIIHDRSFVSSRMQSHKKKSVIRTTTPKLFTILKKHAANSHNMNRDDSGLLNAVSQLKKLRMGFFGKLWNKFCESLSLVAVKSRVIKKHIRHLKKPIKPDELFKLLWDIIIMFFILADLVLLPFRISFEDTSGDLDDYFIQYDTIQMVFFFTDILLSFNTGFYQDGNVVLDRRKITLNYLRLWFWIDLISSIPYENISNAIEDDSVDNKKQVALLQVVKFLRFFKLIRVIRIAKLKLLIKKLKHFIYTSRLVNGILSLIKLCMIISLLAHWIACGWRYMAITSNDGGWIREKGLETADIKVQYIASLYFAVTTMMTVGYGDITPENPNEMVYTIIVMLLGGGMFGYIMNSIAIIVSSLEDEKSKIRKKILTVSRFMQRRGLARDVQAAVKRYLEFIFEDEGAIGQTEKEMFNALSTDLREQVYDQLNGRLLYQNKLLTTNFSKKCLYYATAIIEEKTFTPAETVLTLKDPGDCIYFINKGTLNFFVPKTDVPFLSLTKGDHFGEAYFFQATSRTFIVKSDGFSHLLFLRREKFLESLNDFPEDKEMFCMIRDKISLYKDYTILQQNCAVCNDLGHIIEQCPKLQYLPSKEEVSNSFIRLKKFERANFLRGNRKRYHARSDLPSLAEKANTIVNTYPIEVLDIKTVKEIKDEENLVDSPEFKNQKSSFLQTLHPHFTSRQSVEDTHTFKQSPSIFKDYDTNRLVSRKVVLYNPTVGEVDFIVKSEIEIDKKTGTVWHVDSSNVLFALENFEFDRVKTYTNYFTHNNVNQISDRLRRKHKSQREVEDIKRLKQHLGNFFRVKEKEKIRSVSKALSLNHSQSIKRTSKSEIL